MRPHIFVSYRHDEPDSTYVRHLASFLAALNLEVWFDSEIITGNRWPDVIRERIDTCAALVVVMTPGAEGSAWVSREIARAEAQHKPILPMLLVGAPFFTLADLQYEDVRDGQMPSLNFVEALKGIFGAASVDLDVHLQERTKYALKANVVAVSMESLTSALQSRLWRDADILTDSVMTQVVGRKWNDWVRHPELARFPCSALMAIDSLWQRHSNGRFGFTAQREIWHSIGMPQEPPRGDDDAERAFGDRVGWRVNGQWLEYDEYAFGLDAQPGHLPRHYCRHASGWWLGRSFLISKRLDECSRDTATNLGSDEPSEQA